MGWSDPKHHFGHGTASKSGVAPAHPSVLPVSKLNVAPCATSALPTTSRQPPGDANRDGKGDLCLSCTRHLSTPEMRLRPFGIGTPYY